MKTLPKMLTIAAVGLLLGFGLCGIETLLPPSKAENFGGTLAVLGFSLCVVSLLLFVVAFLYFALTEVVDHFRRQR